MKMRIKIILFGISIAVAAICIVFAFIQLGHIKEKETQNKKAVVESDNSEYTQTLNRIYALNVGDYFNKETLKTFECIKEGCYQVWIDIKSQESGSSLYEIKGTDNFAEAGIAWRFYIRTENDFIISIKKN